MFPHTPDNTFLGFVVEDVNSSSSPANEPRQNISLVYGKDRRMWKGKENLLRVGIPLVWPKQNHSMNESMEEFSQPLEKSMNVE